MKALTICHVKSLQDSFEIILTASIVALVADTGWVLHDVLSNGMSIQYAFIGGGLVTATGMTIWATIKHHMNTYSKMTKELLRAKLLLQKQRNKKKRK